MHFKKRPSWAISESEVTPESVYLNRRKFMSGVAVSAAAMAAPGLVWGSQHNNLSALTYRKADTYAPNEDLTPYKDVIRYNNFYEFGPGKEDPSRHAGQLVVDPWSINVEGECARPGRYALEDLLQPHSYQERIYRLRCVEAWSMVIPWVGIPLADVLAQLEPTSKAKYVYFETLERPEQMPGQRSVFSTIDWPYREGLRMDEAMNELSFLAVGLYGRELPNQNGAPIRLVVPWKYGFKSIKSIVRIRFMEEQPKTSWEMIAPDEYGFYANVNPEVDHPRWSQKRERRLPSGIFSPNWRETEKFNGYGEQVAHLYKGMDLAKYY